MKVRKIVPMIKIEGGEEIPLFYLPIRIYFRRYAIEAWIFPLAPFVLIYRIIKNIFWSIWSDLNEFLGLLTLKKKKPMNILQLLKKYFTIKEIYRCEDCDFWSKTKRGLAIHKGKMHILKSCKEKMR